MMINFVSYFQKYRNKVFYNRNLCRINVAIFSWACLFGCKAPNELPCSLIDSFMVLKLVTLKILRKEKTRGEFVGIFEQVIKKYQPISKNKFPRA